MVLSSVVVQLCASSSIHTSCIITRSFKYFTDNLAVKVHRFIEFIFQWTAIFTHVHLLALLLGHLWQVKCHFNLLLLSSWIRPVSCYRANLVTFYVKEKREVYLLTTEVLFIWQGDMGLILILNMKP